MEETPEFLRWAIERPCPLRDHDDWQDPERTERQLRALREYGSAVLDNRIFEGVCVHADAQATTPETPRGFLADEILWSYGGEVQITSACGPCRANVLSQSRPGALAGCYGWFVAPDMDLPRAIERAVADLELESSIREQFLPTQPTWYGLWMDSPLRPGQVALLSRLIRGVADELTETNQDLDLLIQALETAMRFEFPLHVTLSPRGIADATSWTVASHCPRCKAEMPANVRACRVCGKTGHAAPPRRRNVRGQRPYRALADFLGADFVEPFFQRYAQREHFS